jgi:hypothetical protein
VSKALFPFGVCDEPKIYPCCPAEQKSDLEHQANPVIRNFHKNRGKDQGDVLICSLWARGTDCIIDVHITPDVDAESNLSKDPDKVLTAHEREKKKKKYLEPCLEHFTLFVVSPNGLLGKEAKTLPKKILALLAEKWEKLYSEVCGYVNAHMSIAVYHTKVHSINVCYIPVPRSIALPVT